VRFVVPLSILATVTCAGTSFADDEVQPHRRFGLGSYGGGGYVQGVTTLEPPTTECECMSYGFGAQFELPTLLVQGFPLDDDDLSIDVNEPLTETIIFAAGGTFLWRSDVFLNFNAGSGIPRLIVGPGLGFSVIATAGKSTLWSIRLPAQIGLELLTTDEAFGFKIVAQPVFAVGGSRTDGVYAGGGGVLELGMSGYKRDTPDDDGSVWPAAPNGPM